MSQLAWTSYTLQKPRYTPDHILKVGGHYGKVKSRSHYDTHTYPPLRNVHTKYERSISYSFWDTVGRNFPTAFMSTQADTLSENNTYTALKGYGVKMISISTKRTQALTQI